MKFEPKPLKETADISRGDRSWKAFVKNSLSVIIVLVGLYLLLGLASDILARQVSPALEARLFPIGSQLGKEPDPRVRQVFEQLLNQDRVRDLQFHLREISGEPNAFALPGGAVLVTSELLENLETDQGLAMVLAHELGHHHHRHTLRLAGRKLLHRLVYSLLFGSGGNSIVEQSIALAQAGYSREQEREADAFGLELVHAAFQETQGALEFFERLGDNSVDSRWSEFAASHPLTEYRLRALREQQERLELSR